MNRVVLRFIALVLVLLFSAHLAAKSRDPLLVELPELEVMPDAQWFWVSKRMARNNIPMTIKMFSYRGEAIEVKNYYTSLWKTKGHGKSRIKTIGDLTVLGYQLDGYLYSVQYSQKGKIVEGKIVVSTTPLTFKYEKKSQIPLPPRSEITNKLESLDEGRRSETLNVSSRLRVPQLVDFYKAEFEREGWKIYSRSGDSINGAVLSFQRGGELLQLTITGLQGRNSKFSEVLIHWIK